MSPQKNSMILFPGVSFILTYKITSFARSPNLTFSEFLTLHDLEWPRKITIFGVYSKSFILNKYLISNDKDQNMTFIMNFWPSMTSSELEWRLLFQKFDLS